MKWLYDLLGVDRELPPVPTVFIAPPSKVSTTIVEFKFRVITSDTGGYMVQYSSDMIEWINHRTYKYGKYGMYPELSVYDNASEAITKVDELVRRQVTRLNNLKNAGKVIYGPKP